MIMDRSLPLSLSLWALTVVVGQLLVYTTTLLTVAFSVISLESRCSLVKLRFVPFFIPDSKILN